MEEWFAGLSVLQLSALAVFSFLGSFMTAALGVGGGAFLIAIMADLVPPLALVPLHGVVQLGSNITRATMTRRHRDNRVVGYFLTGAMVASLAAVFLISAMDPSLIPLLIAVFILWLCWGPMPEIGLGKSRGGLVAGGFLTTLATMLVGASGPLVSAWLGRSGVDKWTYTANFSSCMSLQHGLKILAFGFAGFAFTPWIPVLVVMIGCGILGTKAGLLMLGRIPETSFRKLFKVLLTLLAIRMLLMWW